MANVANLVSTKQQDLPKKKTREEAQARDKRGTLGNPKLTRGGSSTWQPTFLHVRKQATARAERDEKRNKTTTLLTGELRSAQASVIITC